MATAAELTATSRALLQTNLACPLGARRARLRATGVTEKEEALLQWARYEQWLQAQRDDWLAYRRTQAAQPDRAPQAAEADAIDQQVDELKDALLRRAADLARTREYLARLEQQPVYAQLAFADASAPEEQRRAAQLLRYRDQLVVEALALHRQASERLQALNALRRDNLELQATNRATMAQIAAAEAAKAEARREAESASQRMDPAAARRAEDLSTTRDVNRISRHVLQNLIIASGVDWSQDAVLLELMLKLEGAPLIDT